MAAAAELGLKPSRCYELYSAYLRACAHGHADTWSPGRSGGDHHPDWPPEVSALLTHANTHETHRELGTTPQAAREAARAEKRSVLRPVPACPWWPFVWSQRTRVRVGDDGQVPVGSQRHPLDAPPRSLVFRWLRPNCDLYYFRHATETNAEPQVLLDCPVCSFAEAWWLFVVPTTAFSRGSSRCRMRGKFWCVAKGSPSRKVDSRAR